MAKKAKTASGYDWVKATVDCGDLRLTYHATGAKVDGRTDHDEDVSDWSDDDIRNVAAQLLDIPSDCAGSIEVVHV